MEPVQQELEFGFITAAIVTTATLGWFVILSGRACHQTPSTQSVADLLYTTFFTTTRQDIEQMESEQQFWAPLFQICIR